MQPQHEIVRLNISTTGEENKLDYKIDRIMRSPLDPGMLSEIRNLIFRIPIRELEHTTRNIAEQKLLSFLFQIGQVPGGREAECRLECLSLLAILNYRFHQNSERLTKFFNYISTGSMAEMAEALSIIRQSFESLSADASVSNFKLILAQASSKIGLARLNWLITQYDKIDASMFFPFLTLFTVLSFCAKQFESLKELFNPVFELMETFIMKELPDAGDYLKLLPVLAMKARMIHSYSLALDGRPKPNGKTVPPSIGDAYQVLMQSCPKSFHLLYEEIVWSFLQHASCKTDPARIEKIIDNVAMYIDSSIEDKDAINTKLAVTMRMFDIVLQSPKIEWSRTAMFVKATIELLFIDHLTPLQRSTRFKKCFIDLRQKFSSGVTNGNYHFGMLFGIAYHVKQMGDTLVRMWDSYNERTADLAEVQKLILVVLNSFDSLANLLAVVEAVIPEVMKWKNRNDTKWQLSTPTFPFSQTENDIVLEMFVDLMFILMHLRSLSNKCGFGYASQNTSGSTKTNMEMCAVQINFMKFYDRIKRLIHFIFQQFSKMMQSYHPMILANIWTLFFQRFFEQKEKIPVDASFIRSFYCDLNSFSAVYLALTQFITMEIEEPKHGVIVMKTAITIIRKITEAVRENTAAIGDIKEKNHKLIQYSTQMIYQKIQQYLTEIPNVGDIVTLMIVLANFHRAVFPKLSQPDGNLPAQNLSVPFIVKIAHVMSEQVGAGKIFIELLDTLKLIAPSNHDKALETQAVVDTLVNIGRAEPTRTLQILRRIHDHNKTLNVFKDPERNRKIGDMISKAWPKCTGEDVLMIAKLTKKLRFESRTMETPLNSCYVFENEMTVPSDQMIYMAVHSIIENPQDDKLWDALEQLMTSLFQTMMHGDVVRAEGLLPRFEVRGSIANTETGYHKALITAANLLTVRSGQVVSIFKKLCCIVCPTPLCVAHVTCALNAQNAELSDDDWLEIYAVIQNKQACVDFLNAVSYITTVCMTHPATAKFKTVVNTMKYVSHMNMATMELVRLVMSVITTSLFTLSLSPFPGDEFVFGEIEGLPDRVKNLIRDTKEMLITYAPNEEEIKQILEGLTDSESLWRRYVIGELISGLEISKSIISGFLEYIFENKLYKHNYLMLRIAAIVLRARPEVFADFEPLLIDLITPITSDWKKVQLPAKDAAIDVVLVMLNQNPFLIEKFKAVVLTLILEADKSLLFMANFFRKVYTSATKETQGEIREALRRRLNDDSVTTMAKWEEIHCQRLAGFGKWNSIRCYWSIWFIIMPHEATSCTFIQLREVVNGTFDNNTMNVFKTFKVVGSQLVNKLCIDYLVGAGYYVQVMKIFMDFLIRYGASITNEEYDLFVTALSLGKETGLLFAKNHLQIEDRAWCIHQSVITKALSTCYAKDIRKALFKDPAVQSILEASETPTTQHLSLAYIACADEAIFEDETLLQHVAKIIISAIGFQCSTLSYLSKFISFVTSTITKWSRSVIVSIITKIIMTSSPMIVYMGQELINKFLEVCSLEDIAQCNADTSKTYLEVVIVPYLKKHPDQVDSFLEAIAGYHHLVVTSVLLFTEQIPDYKVGSRRAIDLYEMCSCDEDRHMCFEIWSKSEDEGGFMEMFRTFLSSITVYLTVYQRNACEKIKFPHGCKFAEVLNPLVKRILDYQKSPPIVCSLWSIMINNLSVIPNPLTCVWPLFLRQTQNLRLVFGKKTQLLYLAPMITHMTKILCSSEPPEGREHHAIVNFCDFALSMLRTVLEQPTAAKTSGISPIIKCAVELVERFGSQVHIVGLFFAILTDFYQKQQTQAISAPHPAPPPPALPQQVTASHSTPTPSQATTAAIASALLRQHALGSGSGLPAALQKVRAPLPQFMQALQTPQKIQAMRPQMVQQRAAVPQAVAQAAAQAAHPQQVTQAAVQMQQSQQTLQSNQQQIQQQNAEIFDMLLKGTPKILEVALQYDRTVDFEAIADLLIAVIQNPGSLSWSHALLSLSYIANSGLCQDKLCELAREDHNDDVMMRFFPIFWCHEPVSELRMTKYLPFAMRMMKNENADKATARFLLATVLETIICNPYDSSLDVVTNELMSNSSRFFRSLFIKHFAMRANLHPKMVVALGDIFRQCGLDTIVMNEVRNSDIKEYLLSLNVKEHNQKLSIFGRSFDFDQFPSLSEWKLAETLPDPMHSDLMAGIEKQRQADCVTYKDFKMYRHAMMASGEGEIDSRFLRDMFPNWYPKLHGSVAESLATSLDQDLGNSIRELHTSQHLSFTEEFGRFWMVYSLYNMRNGKGTGKPMPEYFPPQMHKAFHEVRREAVEYLMQRREVHVDEAPFENKYRKAMYQTFMEMRPALPNLSDQLASLDVENRKCVKKMLLTLAANNKISNNADSEEWQALFFKMIYNRLVKSNSDDLAMSVLMKILPKCTPAMITQLTVIGHLNDYWSYQLCHLLISHPHIAPLASLLHPAFYIGVMGIPHVNLSDDVMIHLSAISSMIDGIQAMPNTTAMLEKEEHSMYGMINTPFFCKGCVTPLMRDERLFCILPSIEYEKGRVTTFYVRTMTGKKVRYVLSHEPMMDYNFSLLVNLLDTRLHKYGGSRMRGQTLQTIGSIKLRNCYISRTPVTPFSGSVASCDRNFTLKRNNILWHTQFAERYAALVSVQLLLGAKALDPEKMWFDADNAILSVDKMESGDVSLFLDGDMANYMNPVLARGPFKRGIMSSFLAFTMYKDEVLAYIGMLIGENQAATNISKYSINDRQLAEVENDIDALIEQAGSTSAPSWLG